MRGPLARCAAVAMAALLIEVACSSQGQVPASTAPSPSGQAPAAVAGPIRSCAFDYCPPQIPGPLTRWPWSGDDRYLRLAPTHIELMNPDGTSVWSVRMNSAQLPDLVAEGDFLGSGTPGFIFDELRPATPAQDCFGHPMSIGGLVFVDGASGRAWRPVPPMLDVCWSYGYATHQFGIGTAYVGRFAPAGGGDQVLVFPYYAKSGWVLSYTSRLGWRRLQGSLNELPYPSTAAYDSAYDAANPAPCASFPGRETCYVWNSHVPNAIFVAGDHAAAAGLLVLTSGRAFIYRPDFTPTSDVVWIYPEGGGRNYGLVDSKVVGDQQWVTLVGGCSVAKTRDTMRTGNLSDDPCGLHHHYEFFVVHGQTIVQHEGRFYGWSGTDGIWQNRLEFPFPTLIPLAGTTLWAVFNLYRDGEWRAELLPNPADPSNPVEVPGWYVWGSVTDRTGDTYLAATRTSATQTTSVASYVPPWEFDLLAWRGGGLVSAAHYDGVVPSLALAPPGPSYHASDGDPFGLVSRPSSQCGPALLLVESANALQSYVALPQQIALC